MSHELVIHYFKSGTGFTAKCSCGEKIGRADSCNGSGLAYWLYQVQQAFQRHISGGYNVTIYYRN